MSGYDPKFLEVAVPLPTLSAALKSAVLKRGGKPLLLNYPNYSVLMDAERRAPIYAALNIDQSLFKKTKRKDWKEDKRIGKDQQLNNDYYKHNPWDRGHLAMRSNASWGETLALAQKAATETFYYPNASFQHQNYNPDEWLMLEDWVGDLKLDIDGKISSFSGPIYGDFSRTITPIGRRPADVPAAFFKVVFFVNKSRELESRAFIAYQDEEAIADRSGRKTYNVQTYQTTVREIAEKTGLSFKKALAAANPLLYTKTRTRAKKYSITHFPERIEIDRPEEIVDGSKRRKKNCEDEIDVYIAGAMVNAPGKDRGKEWVSIINLGKKKVSVGSWDIETTPNYKAKGYKSHRMRLNKFVKGDMTIFPGESVVVKLVKPLHLMNTGGTVALYAPGNKQVDRVKYTKDDVRVGKPVVLFEYQKDRKWN